jgi:hypothetical protein
MNYLFVWKRISIFYPPLGKVEPNQPLMSQKFCSTFSKSGGTKNLFLDFD